jgi:hypothetical protein
VACPNGCLLQWEYTAMQSCIENCNSSICGNAYASKNNPINGQTGMPSCPTGQGPEVNIHTLLQRQLSAAASMLLCECAKLRTTLSHLTVSTICSTTRCLSVLAAALHYYHHTRSLLTHTYMCCLCLHCTVHTSAVLP